MMRLAVLSRKKPRYGRLDSRPAIATATKKPNVRPVPRKRGSRGSSGTTTDRRRDTRGSLKASEGEEKRSLGWRQARAAPTPAGRPSSVAGSVLHHPSHKLAKRIARMGRHLGHQARLGHAGLRVDLKDDEIPGSSRRVVVSQVGAADPRQPSA